MRRDSVRYNCTDSEEFDLENIDSNAPKQQLEKILILSSFLTTLVLAAVFFLGALAHEKCVFPFCHNNFHIGITLFSFFDDTQPDIANIPYTAKKLVQTTTNEVHTSEILTNLYNLQFRVFRLDEIGKRGGGIAPYRDELILANRLGALYLVNSSGQFRT